MSVDSKNQTFVAFTVADTRYAIHITQVREVIQPLLLVTPPQAPAWAWVVGVADYRDEVIPVVHMRARFGLASLASLASQEPATRRTKWIVVRSKERTLGLIVDAVIDVFESDLFEHRDLPALGPRSESLPHVCTHRGGLVFVIDTDRIFNDEQMNEQKK